MTHGFMVLNQNTDIGWTKRYMDKYLEIREHMFGYAPEHPQQLIPLGTDSATGMRKILLKNAHQGLVKTRGEAERLYTELRNAFPACSFEIVLMEYPEAETIHWITS